MVGKNKAALRQRNCCIAACFRRGNTSQTALKKTRYSPSLAECPGDTETSLSSSSSAPRFHACSPAPPARFGRIAFSEQACRLRHHVRQCFADRPVPSAVIGGSAGGESHFLVAQSAHGRRICRSSRRPRVLPPVRSESRSGMCPHHAARCTLSGCPIPAS